MTLGPLKAPNEQQRLASLRAYGVLDTPPDPRLDAITRVAAKVFRVPIALVSLVDEHRQWIKSAAGCIPAGTETTRDIAFCAHALLHPHQPLVVADATRDPRFANNPAVTEAPGIRFYAGVPLLGIDGYPLGTLCIIDTTSRVISSAELETLADFALAASAVLDLYRNAAEARQSEAYFRAMADDAPVMIWVTGPDGNATFLNRLWCETTGQTLTEALGYGWTGAIHEEDRGTAGQAFQSASAQRLPFRTEYRLCRADGCWAWVIDTGQPRFGANGCFLGYVGAVLDITERRAAEDALRESEDHYRSSVELNPQIPWTATPSGSITEVSPRWTDLTGLSLGKTLGEGWTHAVHPADLDRTVQHWKHALASGEAVDVEYRLRLCDGTFRWFRARAAPKRAANGQIVRWYGTLEDIQDRKAANQALLESEAFARSILENSPDCIRVFDPEGQLLFMNGAGYRLLEIEARPVPQEGSWGSFAPAAHQNQIASALEAALAGQATRFTISRSRNDGSEQWLDLITSRIPGADEPPSRLLSIARDVTAPVLAQREAESLAARLSSVLESTTDSVVMLDREWRLTYANRNAYQLFADRSLRFGESVWSIFPEKQQSIFANSYNKAMDEQVPVAFEDYLAPLDLWLDVHVYPAPGGLSVFFRDVTERRKAEQQWLIAQEKLEQISHYDALTGLPNRLLFCERLEAALAETRRRMNIAVLSLDLDGFAAINDTLGHSLGDLLLQQFAQRLQNHAGVAHTVARFGGDEFAVIQTSRQQPSNIIKLGSRIIKALSEPFDLNGQQVVISTSVGMAASPMHGTSAEELLKAAGIALFAAKAEGYGTQLLFQPGMHETLQNRHTIGAALRQAISHGEFELHYQPLVRLRDGDVSGFEALIRWRHPERGMISPADFIPAAEELGLITAIGEWALRRACHEAAGWPAGISVAVNLSPVQFRSAELLKIVGKALSDAGLPPGQLQLEITETLLLQNNERNLEALLGLRSMGVKIALDDFGTGYSSLSYLHSFPFDKVKLDRSFVSPLPASQGALAIVRAVAGLGSALGITTTAEGIETVEQMTSLQAEGYDEGQGYLFSRPVRATEIHSLIHKRHSQYL
jgi:diguanylate cyclase (GGDEF)-like protein/PAS domain S-box-containing protein